MQSLRSLLAFCLGANLILASEGPGVVQFGGLPVPGATVVATQGEKKFSVLTNEDGAYLFKDLPDGVWSERVEMLGFAPAAQDVTVGPATPKTVWELKILSFDELKALAPIAAPAEPAAPEPSITAAASPAPQTAAKKPAAKSGFQRTEIAGKNQPAPVNQPEPAAQADSTDSFAINGSANNGAASPFATSPAFGNGRRGRGSLYNGTFGFTLGTAGLDARPFSITGQDTPKAGYNHVQANIAVGGPLRIPHVFMGNNPVNFFVAYQLNRNKNADTVPYLVPTLDQRNGILPDGTTVPASQISPQAQALLRLYPLPNFTGSTRYNYQTTIGSRSDSDGLSTRLSKSLNRSNQVFGTFGWQRVGGDDTNLFNFIDTNHSNGIDITGNWTHRFSQRMFGTMKYQFNRLATQATPFFANSQNISGNAGITGNDQSPLNWGPPSLNFASGIASLSDGLQFSNRTQTQSIGWNMYVSRSPHNITIGGDFKRVQFNSLGQQNPRGSFTFTGAATGLDFRDFLSGVPDTSSIAYGNADKYFRSNIYDVYGTDDWRLTPSLTINAGMRWEYNSPITEKYGRLVNLAIAPAFTSETPEVANAASHPLLNPYRAGFQPRVGVSWRPISGSSLVVRSGYGITRDTSVYQSIASRMSQQSPLSKSLSVQNTAANPLTLANGFVASTLTTPNTFAVDPNFKPGYAQTWQLQLQRDLPASLVMMATYTGIKGTRAQQVFLPNTYPAGAANPCPACASGYAFLTSNGNSTKESAQFQLRRRLRSGFTATLQYTFSKAIDDAALGGRGQGGQVIAQNWLDLSAERGLSSFDQRHVVNFSTQYTLKQWTLTTQIVAGTGFPLSPLVIAAVNGTGVTGTIRPDYTGADVYAAPAGLFLNPAAYTVAALGRWGNAGRNSITGPSQFTLDSSLERNFKIKDRLDTNFRLNAMNALNHVVFPNWNTIAGSAQFGLPTRANTMRTVQAIVRVRF